MLGKVITIAQQKGGSGKTTLAVTLATAMAKRNKSVAVLDTDPQGSLGRWFMTRREALNGDAGLEFATASAWGAAYECEKLRRDHDIVIIDTPPKIDADLRPALRESDLVIIPVAASHLDVWATQSVLELAEREDRPVLIVLNRANTRAKLTADVVRTLGDLKTAKSKTVLGNRVAFAEALGQGYGVAERGASSPAGREASSLADEVLTLLNG